MNTATARRPAHTTPLGTGELHRALEASRDLARLHDFCSAHVCTPDLVSNDGKRLNPVMVFAFMRSRGYGVSDPVKPQHQPRKDQTTWFITITLPDGNSVQLGFCTPNTS